MIERELLKSKDEIKKWLNNFEIENYIINDDLTVDVDGDVLINKKNFKYVPFNFGIVSGSFQNALNSSILTLEGFPTQVGRKFVFHHCYNINSLKGAPKRVGGVVILGGFPDLTSLEGCPQYVKYIFYISMCHKLKNLKGGPIEVGYYYDCSYNFNLTSLEGAPKRIKDNFYCDRTKIKNLYGAPEYVEGSFICCNCKELETFEGTLKEVGKNFYFGNNPKIKDFSILKKIVKGKIIKEEGIYKDVTDEIKNTGIVKEDIELFKKGENDFYYIMNSLL